MHVINGSFLVLDSPSRLSLSLDSRWVEAQAFTPWTRSWQESYPALGLRPRISALRASGVPQDKFLAASNRDVNEARLLVAKAKAENEAKIVCKNITFKDLLLITCSLSIFALFVNICSQFRHSHSVITMIQFSTSNLLNITAIQSKHQSCILETLVTPAYR